MQEKPIALEMKNITKLYAGTVALEQVNFQVHKGEIHGLIGKNGAGKSTLVGILSGIIPASRGEIIINNQVFSSFSPIVAKRNKIAIITQEPQVIEDCTVAENLFMPGFLDGKRIINWKKLARRTTEILEAAKFPADPLRPVRDLSISARQLLLVIKACYVEQADIIIMDEVSASLTQRDQSTLYNIIEDQVRAGKTIIFISHHTKEILQVCDRVTVLRDGRTAGTDFCSDLDLKSLSARIVGNSDFDDTRRMTDKRDMVEQEVALEIKDLTAYGKFKQINLSLRMGEIVGLAGLRGSGRTEIFKSIVGLERRDAGAIFLHGQEKRYKSPADALSDGVVYLAEEREREGLISSASIKHNMTISVLSRISKGGIVDAKRENHWSDELIKELGVKSFSREQLINQLSGGNKQKVMVGKLMAKAPLVCLLDEPTRGVDIEAKESILETINEKFRENACVLITSPGIEDLIKICDRILVVYEGEIIGEFHRDEFSEQEIYRATQGENIHVEGIA